MNKRIQRINKSISIPAPARGATCRVCGCLAGAIFQFPPLREGRRAWWKPSRTRCRRFQFPPLREGRHLLTEYNAETGLFQFPPLREGRLLARWTFTVSSRLFQFPPLREGRHIGAANNDPPRSISIPAPARGATVFEDYAAEILLFQFPPLREGRQRRIGVDL